MHSAQFISRALDGPPRLHHGTLHLEGFHGAECEDGMRFLSLLIRYSSPSQFLVEARLVVAFERFLDYIRLGSNPWNPRITSLEEAGLLCC